MHAHIGLSVATLDSATDMLPPKSVENHAPTSRRMCARVTQVEELVVHKDAEIARLRLVVQQECIERTSLLRKLKQRAAVAL
jgi:hypothetical protein